jgi:hypothetical protein
MRPPPPAGTLAAMNSQTRHRLRSVRAAAIVAAAAGLALLAAGCGSGSGGSPAAGGSANPVAGSAGSAKLVAYSQCMRSHGIPDFPDPGSSGGISKQAIISAQSGVSNSQVQAASTACQHLIAGLSLGGQPTQTITTQDQQDYLKAVACMHAHGIASFPEPTFPGGQVEFPNLANLVNTQAPQFIQAEHVCKKLIPAGLPGNESGG